MSILGKGKKPDEMSFLEHLEALRWHIIRSFIAIVVVGIVAFINKDLVFDEVIFAPSRINFITYVLLCDLSGLLDMGNRLCMQGIQFTIQNLDMAGQFLTHIKVSFTVGFILAFPYIFWEFWRFIKPGLYEKEAKSARGMVFICSILFLLGVLFGYFIITPFSVTFLGSYHVSEQVQNNINLGSYITVISMISLATGIIFELPVVSYLLSKLGILTPELMIKYRKHSIIIILFLGAMITPPDVASQIIISIPILILYEISIRISRRVNKKYQEEMAK